MSSVFGILSLFSFFIIITLVLKEGGVKDDRIGAIGFVSFLYGLIGLCLGVFSLLERDRFPFFPRFGFAISFFSCLAWAAVVYVGM